MKIILLFLAALASFTVHAQPPSLTVEQTVRHIYRTINQMPLPLILVKPESGR
ncbi:hypothetical protein JNE110611_3628 [Escherichia coli]|nr:hypothetical protein JNE110611_3628 [Escherichia coli]BDQ83181.1 hypothetical protein PV0671_3492 [Escherichia coli]BDQ88711.1 hypothetical protein JNE071324_3764 [Escherichia coli]BDQ99546.1 hypothetical protein JNE072929_3688 [Escherichia coli]BDR04878.1 hypothetical protein JNE102603_3718 [Escherichia coli]